MPPSSPEARWRHALLLLSTAAGVRAFSIGLTGVLLGLYLARRGYTAGQLGLVVGCGLAGNATTTAWLMWVGPPVNRRSVLFASTVLSGAGLIGVANVSAPLAIAVALIVAEGSGRRISGWRNLRWDDVDFQNEQIRWRAEWDKKGYEDVVPMSETVRDALREARKAQRAIGSAPVFPAPKGPTRPCDRHMLDNWLRKAVTLAKVKLEPGGLWHSLRRKWATERKGYPVKDVAAAGGWRDEGTMLTSYQQVDAATIKQVVLHPTQRLVGT